MDPAGERTSGAPRPREGGAAGTGSPGTVGVVGLGTMGGAMARHLLAAGYRVVGFDVAPDATRALADAGGEHVGGPAEVAARAGVVVLSLPSASAFADVVAGPGGLTSAPAGGAGVVVETSTLPLEVKEQGRHQLADTGVVLLDCPISGTGAQMARRDAVFYLSGDDDAAAMVRPMLETLGAGVFALGAFGNGTRLKLVANHLVTIHNAAAAEALALARAAGVDPAAALPALMAGAGASRILELRGPMMAARDYVPPTMQLKTFLKDLGIIEEFGHSSDCVLDVFAAAAALHRRAAEAGWGDADAASLHEAVATEQEGR